MASRSPNNDPPACTSPLQMDEIFELRIGPNEAADCTGIPGDGNGAGVDHMPIAHTLLPDSPFPLRSMLQTPHSYAHNFPRTGLDLMTDVTQFNSFQNSQVDHNFINIGGHRPFIDGPVQVFPYSEGNTNRIYGSDIHDNMAIADNVMNSSTHLSSFQTPQIDQNFVPIRGNAAGSFQTIRQVGEKNSVNSHRPSIKRNFVSHGTIIPVQYHTPNSGEIGINENFKVNSVQSNCLEKTDGSFLTLGIGDSMEEKSKYNVPSREIAGRNGRIVLPQLNTSHGQNANMSFLNPAHNMTGGFSSFHNNVGGFSNLACNVGSWETSFNNDHGVTYGTNTGWSSSPSNTLQTAQVDMQHFIPFPSNGNLVLGGNGDARFANTDPYKDVQGYPTAASRPLNGSQAGLLDYGRVGLPGLTSESARSMKITSQPSSDQLQECLIKSVRNSESSMISHFPGFLGSTTKQDQSGQQFPAYQGSGSQAAEGRLVPKRIGVQTASNPSRPQNTGPVQHFKDLLGPAFTTGQVIPVTRRNGLAQASNLPVEPSLKWSAVRPPPATPAELLSPVPYRDLLGPTFTRAAEGNRLAQASNALVGTSLKKNSIQPPPASPACSLSSVPYKNILRPSLATGPVIPAVQGNGRSQASSAFVESSLKRSAIQPLPTVPRVQRRKTMPQPSIRPSVPPPAQTAPVLHVKRQGSKVGTTPQPIGHKCMLCKRDISYTPEGPLYQPTIPPAVAVLPCTHVFHDQCLQRITPEDQSEHPPCIPCAIGES